MTNSLKAQFDADGYALCSDGTRSNFQKKEITCPCGCGFCAPSQKMVDTLQKQRTMVNQPIMISKVGGWCRCLPYNAKVGGAESSAHLTGDAADCYIHMGLATFWVSCEKNLWAGMGSYPTERFLHLDVLETRVQRWVYRDGVYWYLF
jgi:hypothetical protein